MNRLLVEQVVLDAVATMARRAVGDVHVELGDVGLGGDAGTTDPERPGPWVSIEWAEPPEPFGDEHHADRFDLPADALFEVTALETKWLELQINGVRLAMVRELGQTPAELRDAAVTKLAPLVAGRLVLTAEAPAAIRVTPVTPGDLWRAVVIAGAAVTLGDGIAARVHEQLYRCALTLTVLGARVGSGQSGVAGAGVTAGELAAALSAELADERTQLDFDAVTMRNVSPQATSWAPRKVGSRREGRLVTVLELGLTARWCTAAEDAKVPTNILPPPDVPPDPPDPDTDLPDVVDSFQWVAPPLDPLPQE